MARVADVAAFITAVEAGEMSEGDVRVVTSEKDAFLRVTSGSGEDLGDLLGTDKAYKSDFIRFMDSSEIISGNATISTNLSIEVDDRSNADSSLTTRISDEESTRSTDVSSLETRLGTEETTRSAADISLANRLDTEEGLHMLHLAEHTYDSQLTYSAYLQTNYGTLRPGSGHLVHLLITNNDGVDVSVTMDDSISFTIYDGTAMYTFVKYSSAGSWNIM